MEIENTGRYREYRKIENTGDREYGVIGNTGRYREYRVIENTGG